MKSARVSLSNSERGFTLIEVLIAITITALLGLGVWQILNSTIRTQSVLERQQGILDELQRTFLYIERDLQQIVSRPVRNEFGDKEYALSNRNTLYLVEFTRAGWRNPLQDQRSELQRVAYELRDKTLVRNYWKVLDRAQDSEPRSVVLNDQIESINIEFLTDKNQWTSDWPTDAFLQQNEESIQQHMSLPKAIKVNIEHSLYGDLYRIYSSAQTLEIEVSDKSANSNKDNKTDAPPEGNTSQSTGGGE